MILKFKHGDAWRFIDNIKEADILPVEDGQFFEGAKGAIQYSRGSEILTQAFSDEAYLLNDNGKTLARIAF